MHSKKTNKQTKQNKQKKQNKTKQTNKQNKQKQNSQYSFVRKWQINWDILWRVDCFTTLFKDFGSWVGSGCHKQPNSNI